MKLVLPLSMIDNETSVTKLTGRKPYLVRREIKIYGEKPQTIKCDPTTVFLVDESGNANALPDYTEVVIHFESVVDLIVFLQKYNEEEFLDAIEKLP